ncbi:DUF6221 family protein [Kitasatospora sp. LaBMicrA B282]|uniref:DUF6221 family protein n=1 Tax=Kitasatospora sp. LaBMicrA B282 TaxID=3420949 RepID=UPI003D0A036D
MAFLRARLQDDCNQARDAMINDGQWRAERTVVVLDNGAEVSNAFLGIGDHIARFNPARILAEVAAKQAIVDVCESPHTTGSAPAAHREELQTTLRLLATVYADHSDYRDSWRPS